ncbi:hypothetical protein SDC9_138034 [bioreactor metagenome]|uniref:Uncharacterized protein n=1 Tax=bioreactor metagenome TaxID=1076179 RepID=A0A645DNR1_9ZZZZ
MLAQTPLDYPLKPNKGSPAYEENIGGIDSDVFLLGMLAAALRWHIAGGAFEDLQQSLLNAFARYVSRDRHVLRLAGYLVDLVDVDNATLGAFHIVIGVLQKPENDVFNVFADITGFR